MGGPGVGTTRVLDEVCREARTADRLVGRVVGTQAHRSTPFGALTHTLPPDTPLETVAIYQRISAQVGASSRPGERAVAGVDDIRWLDDASLGLLTELLVGGVTTVVATVHDHAQLPAALVTIERSCAIRRVEVPPLDREDTADLVYSVMDGAVDGSTVLRLVEESQGYPLFLAELLEGSQATGALTKVLGTWTLDGPPTVTARLGGLVAARIDATGADGKTLVELLAHAGSVSVSALGRVGLLAAAVELEEARLVVSSPGAHPTVSLAQPLTATMVRGRTSPLRRRTLLPRLVDLVADPDRPPEGEDLVRLTLWRLEGGMPVDDAQLAAAALAARALHELDTTVELATIAADRCPTFDVLLVLAETLHDLCRFDEAEEAMRRADEFVNDDISRLRLAVVRHRELLWGRHDPEASVAVLQDAIDQLLLPLARDLGRVACANSLVLSGGVARVPAIIDSLEGDDELVKAAAFYSRTMVELNAGRIEEAVAIAREGLARRSALPATAPIGHPLLSSLVLGLSLADAGYFDEAEEVLAPAYTEAAEQRLTQAQVWVAMTRGRCHMYRGDLTESRLWFMEVRSLSARARFEQGLRVGLSGIVILSAQLGDLDTAREAEVALRELPADGGMRHPMRHLAHAWVAVAERRDNDATAALEVGLAEARARAEWGTVTEFLYEGARMGRARAVAVEMRELPATGPLSVARSLFVKGAAAADASALAAAERAFAHLGAWVSAAESAAELGRVLHAAGRPRDAQGAAHRATQYLVDLGPVHTPMLVDAPGARELSPREREIAELAVDGLPSKLIAQRLGLSVRTVSNHLQNAYLKLGISGREDLAEALAVGD